MTGIREMLLQTNEVQESIRVMNMNGKMKAEQDHKVIAWLIKRYCPGYHLSKNPTRKEKPAASAVYPTHDE